MCDTNHAGCTDRTEVAAVERRRIDRAQQEQLARFEAATKLPGWQWTAYPISRQCGRYRYTVDTHPACDNANVLWCDCTHTFQQWNVVWQVSALRRQDGGVWRQRGQNESVIRSNL